LGRLAEGNKALLIALDKVDRLEQLEELREYERSGTC